MQKRCKSEALRAAGRRWEKKTRGWMKEKSGAVLVGKVGRRDRRLDSEGARYIARVYKSLSARSRVNAPGLRNDVNAMPINKALTANNRQAGARARHIGYRNPFNLAGPGDPL